MDIQTSHEEEVIGSESRGKMAFTQGVVCSLLMGWQSSVANWNDEENLSVAAYMNYTRLFQPPLSNSPLNGAQTIRAVTGEV